LSKKLKSQGVETIVLPFPQVLDVYNEKALGYSAFKKILTVKAIADYNRQIETIGRRYGVACIWGRGTRAALMTVVAARNLKVPIVWDIGFEKESRGLIKLLHWFCLSLSTVVVTQAKCQPRDIFGTWTARKFSSKIETIYPGISSKNISWLEKGKKNNNCSNQWFDILSVGTIAPRKNQMLLLKALQEVVQTFPNVRLRLVGSVADNAYFSQIKEFIHSQDLIQNVLFLGWRDDIANLMSQSNVLVLCSSNEGIPHVVREAMWAGLPVIATAVGGLPETIETGKTGFLIAKNNPIKLQEMIEYCIRNPEALESVRKEARRFAELRFSTEKWAYQYNELLYRVSQKR